MKAKIKVLKAVNQHPKGLSISKVAKEAKVARVTAQQWIYVLQAEGKLEIFDIPPVKLVRPVKEVEQ